MQLLFWSSELCQLRAVFPRARWTRWVGKLGGVGRWVGKVGQGCGRQSLLEQTWYTPLFVLQPAFQPGSG